MKYRLNFAVLLLVILAACDAYRSQSQQGNRGRHSKSIMKVKTGGQRTRKLLNSRETKQANRNNPELVTVKVANVSTFVFGNEELKQQLLDDGSYNPKSAEPYHVIADVKSRNRLFITTPLVKRGIPASLSTIPYDGSPDFALRPYPNLDVHHTTEDTISDCTKQIVSIAPITKTWDDDDTLYALDTGVLNITNNPQHLCPPKIITFDLRTDEIMKTIIIDNAACNSLYVVLWVDSCPAGGPVAYSTDAFGFRLTVTDLSAGVSRHLQSQYFHPRPGFFFTKAGGPPTYLPFGLDGVSADGSCDGKVYTQAFASNIQNVLDKQLIRDAEDGEILDTITQVRLPGDLVGTSGPLAVDPHGERLFFPIQDRLALYCWNTSRPHHADNFRPVAQDDERMQYVSNIQIDPASGRLWMLTNRFPAFVSNTIDYAEYNYYILYININGIVC